MSMCQKQYSSEGSDIISTLTDHFSGAQRNPVRDEFNSGFMLIPREQLVKYFEIQAQQQFWLKKIGSVQNAREDIARRSCGVSLRTIFLGVFASACMVPLYIRASIDNIMRN
uniref:ABC transporter permease n=1 Tax=Ascaris lumbricoides TaxID=6252 RepID=A0A0M3IPU7_ASCLU